MPRFGMLAYEAYFDALAQFPPHTDAWRATAAGLVVLRLVDDWLDDGIATLTANPSTVQAVREAVAVVAERNRVRPILSRLVDAMTQADTVAFRTVAHLLLDYGTALYEADQWALSRDVFTALLRQGEAARERVLTARAAQQLGRVLRYLGQHDPPLGAGRQYTRPVLADVAAPREGRGGRRRLQQSPRPVRDLPASP